MMTNEIHLANVLGFHAISVGRHFFVQHCGLWDLWCIFNLWGFTSWSEFICGAPHGAPIRYVKDDFLLVLFFLNCLRFKMWENCLLCLLHLNLYNVFPFYWFLSSSCCLQRILVEAKTGAEHTEFVLWFCGNILIYSTFLVGFFWSYFSWSVIFRAPPLHFVPVQRQFSTPLSADLHRFILEFHSYLSMTLLMAPSPWPSNRPVQISAICCPDSSIPSAPNPGPQLQLTPSRWIEVSTRLLQ